MWLLVFVSVADSAIARQMNVVFLNPGSKNDIGVWELVSHSMQASANSLGIHLEIIYADRNHVKMMQQAEEVARRERQPDYVILVNEKQSAGSMMSFFKGSSAKILLMHNDLTDEQRKEIGGERGRMANWIGTVTSDGYNASRLLMQALSRHFPGTIQAVGLSGIKSNPVTSEREAGLMDFFRDFPEGRLLQIAHADWSYEGGKEKARLLMERYPELNAIWAANDSMALGALDAVMEAGRGGEIVVGGQGGFPAVLERIVKGEMKATVGTLMTGGFALVLLHDYQNGRDFADDIGVRVKPDDLVVIDDAEKAKQYARIVIEHPERINFRAFSKVYTPGLRHYDFRYERIVEAAGEKPIQ